jgi:hypothetical protein
VTYGLHDVQYRPVAGTTAQITIHTIDNILICEVRLVSQESVEGHDLVGLSFD